jgi:hypothetical protein
MSAVPSRRRCREVGQGDPGYRGAVLTDVISGLRTLPSQPRASAHSRASVRGRTKYAGHVAAGRAFIRDQSRVALPYALVPRELSREEWIERYSGDKGPGEDDPTPP